MFIPRFNQNHMDIFKYLFLKNFEPQAGYATGTHPARCLKLKAVAADARYCTPCEGSTGGWGGVADSASV